MVVPTDSSIPVNIPAINASSSNSNVKIVAIIIPIIVLSILAIVIYIFYSKRQLKRVADLEAAERARGDVGLDTFAPPYQPPPPAYIRENSIERVQTYDKPPESSPPPDTS